MSARTTRRPDPTPEGHTTAGAAVDPELEVDLELDIQ